MSEDGDQLLNYKPVFQRFIEANEALIDCFAAVPKDSLNDMNSGQLDSHCTSERANIRRILDTNEMTMTTLIKDRINVLQALDALGPKIRTTEYIQV